MENQEKIDAKIQELDDQFDFVILAEFFDEGLVILARLLCWDLEDVSEQKYQIKSSWLSGQILEAECPNGKQSEQHHLWIAGGSHGNILTFFSIWQFFDHSKKEKYHN